MITEQPLHDPGGILKIPLCTYTKCDCVLQRYADSWTWRGNLAASVTGCHSFFGPYLSGWGISHPHVFPSSTHSHMTPLTPSYPSAFNTGLQLLPSSERRKSQYSDGGWTGIPQLCIPPSSIPSVHILMLILPTTWTWGLRREHQEWGGEILTWGKPVVFPDWSWPCEFFQALSALSLLTGRSSNMYKAQTSYSSIFTKWCCS